MKKTLFLSTIALTSLVFAGCSNEAEELNTNNSREINTLIVSMPDDDVTTRTAHDATGKKTTWVVGDKIGIYLNGTGNPIEYTASAAGSSVEFTGAALTSGNNYVAVYPFMAEKSIDEVMEVTLDNQMQTGKDNTDHLSETHVMKTESFVASSELNIRFNHAVSIVKISLPARIGAKGASIRGAWGDRLYYLAFSSAIDEAVTAYIAVPASTADTKTLYASVYDATTCYCYQKDAESATNIPLGKMVNVNVSGTPIDYPVTGINAGHEYVTIGTDNWATCNVGACVPWEYGGKYYWGAFDVTSIQNTYYNGTEDIQGKTNLTLTDGTTIGGDVATYKWGNGWKMPKASGAYDVQLELDKLHYIGIDWETDYKGTGINGHTFGTSSAFVFLPAAYGSGNDWGKYWSSSYVNSRIIGLEFYDCGPYDLRVNTGDFEYSVRPIYIP